MRKSPGLSGCFFVEIEPVPVLTYTAARYSVQSNMQVPRNNFLQVPTMTCNDRFMHRLNTSEPQKCAHSSGNSNFAYEKCTCTTNSPVSNEPTSSSATTYIPTYPNSQLQNPKTPRFSHQRHPELLQNSLRANSGWHDMSLRRAWPRPLAATPFAEPQGVPPQPISLQPDSRT
jgi:hypothetical protein